MSDPVDGPEGTLSVVVSTPGAVGPLEVVVLEGPDRGARRRLEATPVRIGSGEEADLVLTDPTISRVHLEMREVRGSVEVVDPGSKNGTFYLGQRIERAVLAPGATLRLGNTTIALQPASVTPAQRASDKTSYGALVGESIAMRRLFAQLEPIEQTELSVLVEGETGTGKELVAREIHARSLRANGPFVVFDGAAAQPTLVESALFGHRRGAFTDAVSDRPGAAVAADGGTLFLDEIGELHPAVQPKLLRFLERREVTPLGAETPRKADARIVAATNRDLAAEVEGGRFRADLFHRLAVLHLVVPPLRERTEDIPLLVAALAKELGDPTGAGALPADLIERLKTYPWPGNVRELRNVVARAMSLGADAAGAAADKTPATPSTSTPPLGPGPLPPYHEARTSMVDAFERHYLERLLAETGGNLSEAARRAGLHRNYVARLAAKHGLK